MNDQSTRRDFLAKTCPAVALLAAGWGLAGCDSNGMENEGEPSVGGGISVDGNTVSVDFAGPDASALTRAGGFLFIAPAKMVLVNTDGTTVRAFTSVCTHQGCDVNQFQNGRLICPCHNSQYDTSGQVVQGPAEQALVEYPVTRDGDILTVQKS